MAIETIHTYLVHPGKGTDEEPKIGGTAVELSGKLFALLDDIYTRSDTECDIDVSFNHASDGTQQNPCRDLVLGYLRSPSLAAGRHIAARLEQATTHRSGLGLLFLLSGKEASIHKFVISRFPADSAILVEEDKISLNVEFLERVFMKSATAYKAAVYQHASLESGFWIGRAIDKQINSREVQLSNYWIAEFLASDFRTTSAAGTRRLAVALKDAIGSTSDVAIKSEIAAAVTLATGLRGRRLSIRDFIEQMNLSEAAKLLVSNQVKQPRLIDDQFQFDVREFSDIVAFRSVELDSGGLLTAESGKFDEIFEREIVDDINKRIKFTTEGTIVGERLRKIR